MLLDLRMPGMGRVEIDRAPRSARTRRSSAYGSVEAAVEAMKLGAVDFLQKPFDPEEVRKLVLFPLGPIQPGNLPGPGI